eukprot:2227447-Lingulodinium_polyedra.AAC.1
MLPPCPTLASRQTSPALASSCPLRPLGWQRKTTWQRRAWTWQWRWPARGVPACPGIPVAGLASWASSSPQASRMWTGVSTFCDRTTWPTKMPSPTPSPPSSCRVL